MGGRASAVLALPPFGGVGACSVVGIGVPSLGVYPLAGGGWTRSYQYMYAREAERNAEDGELCIPSSLVVGMWWGAASLIIGRVWQRMCTFVPK